MRGVTDNRANAFVEAMNGLVQQARARCARLLDSIELHRHRLLANVQAQASAGSSVRVRSGQLRLSRSTLKQRGNLYSRAAGATVP